MTFDAYQKKSSALTTAPEIFDEHPLYAAACLASESGEVCGEMAKHVRGFGGRDPFNLIVELGDVLFFVARVADQIGASMDDIAALNLSKLQQIKNKHDSDPTPR